MTTDRHDPPSAAPLDCEATVRRLWDYLDDALVPARVDEVEAHLATCANCPAHFAFARAFLRALSSGGGARTVSPALRQRVLRALAAAGFAPAAGGAAP